MRWWAERGPGFETGRRSVVGATLGGLLAAACNTGVSDDAPRQRDALAWLNDGQLVVGFFVQCGYPANNRVFLAIDVVKDGEPVWRATASGTPPATVEWAVIGVAPDGFVSTTYDQELLDEITDPSYQGQIGVGVVTLAGETYGGGLNLAERYQLSDDVVLWGGQLTERSAVSCPN